MSIAWAMAVPVIVFVTLVAPIWITLHYTTQWKRMKSEELGEDQVAVSKAELIRLRTVADRLGQRIDALEGVLDAEFPTWRKT